MSHPDIVVPWSRESNYLVVLETPDRPSLEALATRVRDAGLVHLVVTEPDYPDDEQLCALAIEPGEETSRLCSSLPLAMREPAMA